MIAKLRGIIDTLEEDRAIVDVNGVGYLVYASAKTLGRLTRGQETSLWIETVVREDSISLFGFLHPLEKEWFLTLTKVQGVGAKLAIAALSTLRPADLTEAIYTADVKRLTSVKGLGKKTAERIVLELHGKISADELIGTSEGGMSAVRLPKSQADDDAVAALMGLGFTRQESARAVERAKAAGAATVEDIIQAALRGM